MYLTVNTVFILILTYFVVDTRKLMLREEEAKPPRDYRPSKWIANSALDVWYGNKSMIEVLSREFNDIVNRIAMRPMRSTVDNKRIWLNSTQNTFKERTNEMLPRQNKTILIE